MSLDLLAILGERENYYRFKRFVRESTVPNEVWTIVHDLDKYYDSHPTNEQVDWADFATWFCLVQHPSYKEEKINVFRTLFNRLSEYDVSDVAETIIEKYITQDYCTKISDVTLRGAEGESISLDDVRAYLDQYDEELDRATKLESFIVDCDLTELVHTVTEKGLNWRLNFLNKSIGILRKGKLVCFAARPNVGKTTWLASEATFMAPQLEDDEVVLWFNNEEAGTDVKFRVVQAAIGWDVGSIRSDPVKAQAEYEKAVGHNNKILIIDKADLHVKDLEEYLRNYKVGLIIIDQLWKVHGFEKISGTDTARLQHVFQWAREISKKHAPVVTVHQVKTEGEGVDYLRPDMLYLSGTAVQGEVDSLILMGKRHEPSTQNTRYLSIGKNKGAYGPEVRPELREGKEEIIIVPDLAQFEEI